MTNGWHQEQMMMMMMIMMMATTTTMMMMKMLMMHLMTDYVCNCNLQTSKAPLKSQAQGTSLFTSAVSNQRGCPKDSLLKAPVQLPEGERRQIRH